MINFFKSLFAFLAALPAIVYGEHPRLGDDLITIQAMILRQMHSINSQLYDADVSDSDYAKSLALISELVLVKTQLQTIKKMDETRTLAQFKRMFP